MVEPGEWVAGGKAVGVAAKGARKLARKHDTAGYLKTLVAEEVGRAHQVSTRQKVVTDRIRDTWIDPDVIGPVARVLESGEWSQESPALRARLTELLVFGDPAIDDGVVVDLTMAAVLKNLERARVDPKEAAHLDQLITRDELRASKEEILDRLDEVAEGGGALTAEFALLKEIARSSSTTLAGEVSSSDEAVKRLAEHDEEEARNLAEALNAGGEGRVVELIDDPQTWVEQGSAAVWVALGRIAQRIQDYEAAEKAFLTAADHPGIDDRARQLVRASLMAKISGRRDRFDELFAQAREVDDSHPAVVLVEARDTEISDELLETLERAETHPRLDDALRIELEIIRAGVLLGQERQPEAENAFERARAIDPCNIIVREFEAVLWLSGEQQSSAAVSSRIWASSWRRASDLRSSTGRLSARSGSLKLESRRPAPWNPSH